MAYRIQLGAPLGDDTRRILLEQIERAESRLRSGKDRAEAVHEARKHFKRVRALLRLIRPAIGKEVFARENADFRETGQLLAGARDAHVLGLTLARLEAEHGLDPNRDTAALRKAIDAALSASAAGSDSDHVRLTLKRLDAARDRISGLGIEIGEFSVIATGLRNCFREAIESRATALTSGTDEDYHEWRKRVQQHWRQMGLLAKAWPDYFNARIRVAKRLAMTLGDDHDLAMLAAFMGRQPSTVIGARERRKLIRLVRSSQAALREASVTDAERLFSDGAEGLARRVEAYWRAASTRSRMRAAGDSEAEHE